MLNLLKNFWKEEEGQDLTEYALLIAGIALFLVGGITTFSQTLSTAYSRVGSGVNTAPGGGS